MEIHALGRNATFGDIYDARTNEFPFGIRAFKEKTKTPIHVNSVTSSNFSFSSGSRQSEKVNAWGISGELKLGILCCETFEPTGSAKFMKNSSSSKNTVECSYILQTKTIEEKIHWDTDEIKKNNNFKKIENYGTHMVVGIHYGGNAVVTLSYDIEKHDNVLEMQKALEGQFQGFPNVKGNVNVINSVNTSNLAVTYHADVVGDTPTTVEEAKTFMQNLGSRLKEYNNGKGVKIAYKLEPLEKISKFLGINIEGNIPYIALPLQDVTDVNILLEDMESKTEEFSIFVQDLENKKKSFLKTDQQKWENKKNKITRTSLEIRTKINKMVMKYHNENEAIKTSFDDYKKEVSELKESIEEAIKELKPLITKADFIKKSNDHHVIYINDEREYLKYKLKDTILKIGLYSVNSTYETVFEKFIYKCNLHHEKKNKKKTFTKLLKVYRRNRFYLFVDAEILDTFVEDEFKKPSNATKSKILKRFPDYPLYKYIFDKGYELYISIMKLNIHELSADLISSITDSLTDLQISLYDKRHSNSFLEQEDKP